MLDLAGEVGAGWTTLRLYPFFCAVLDHRGVWELPRAGGYKVAYQLEPDTGSNADADDVVILRVFGPGQEI